MTRWTDDGLGLCFVRGAIAAFTFLFGVRPDTISPSERRAIFHETLVNFLIVAGIGMPFVLGDAVCSYWVF